MLDDPSAGQQHNRHPQHRRYDSTQPHWQQIEAALLHSNTVDSIPDRVIPGIGPPALFPQLPPLRLAASRLLGYNVNMSYSLSDADQVQMLRKLMLYWDGQWFLKTVEAAGLEAAIDLNAQVRASFGRIEMRVLLKTLAKAQADDLADAMRLLETYSAAFLGRGLRAEFAALDVDRAEVIVRQCVVYEGAKLAALPRADQACVACETVWNAWLETLLPGTHVEVEYPLRQGKGDPYCRFIIGVGQRGSY
jgi:hypothetical protein